MSRKAKGKMAAPSKAAPSKAAPSKAAAKKGDKQKDEQHHPHAVVCCHHWIAIGLPLTVWTGQVIADCFQSRFKPLTLDEPRVRPPRPQLPRAEAKSR
jgi:hypothetical protein